MFPAVNSSKDNTKLSLISEITSDEHGTNKNWENGDISQNYSLCTEFKDVGSAFRTSEWILPRQFVELDDTQITVSEGQDFTGILDTFLMTTCSAPCYKILEAERTMLLGTAMPEKAYVYNDDLPRDTNQQLNDLEVRRDEDAVIDSVSTVN